jgi:carbon starvation protein CstA
MILMMSDQQMITGIALMVSAITQLRCGISAYHWQITIYLVWFSSFTHLATLAFLRGYLHENSPLRWWRLFFMTALIGLLTAALVPTRRGDWLPDDQPAMSGTPALCMFDYSRSPPESASWITMLFSILVLSISYTTRAIKLFKWSSEASRSFFSHDSWKCTQKASGNPLHW